MGQEKEVGQKVEDVAAVRREKMKRVLDMNVPPVVMPTVKQAEAFIQARGVPLRVPLPQPEALLNINPRIIVVGEDRARLILADFGNGVSDRVGIPSKILALASSLTALLAATEYLTIGPLNTSVWRAILAIASIGLIYDIGKSILRTRKMLTLEQTVTLLSGNMNPDGRDGDHGIATNEKTA